MLDVMHFIYRVFTDIINFMDDTEIITGISILTLLIILSLFNVILYFLRR